MKNLIFFLLLFSTIAATAQNTKSLDINRVKVKDSFYLGGKWYKNFDGLGGGGDSSSIIYIYKTADSLFEIKCSLKKCDTTFLIADGTGTGGFIDSSSRIISGTVVWDSVFKYHTTNFSYLILGRKFTAAATTFTIPGSDTVLDRFSVVYADTSGNIGVINGTPNLPAAIPSVNPNSRIVLATIFVQAAVTEAPIFNESDLVHRSGVESINGKKTFTDTLILDQKPIRFLTNNNANVSLFDTRVKGVAFPWFKVDGHSVGSRLLMGANNSAFNAHLLSFICGYADTILSSIYTPITINSGDYLSFYAQGTNFNSDSLIRFSAGYSGTALSAWISRANVFTFNQQARYLYNRASLYTARDLVDKNYVDSSIFSIAATTASAATITPPGKVFHISGTTNISTITAAGLSPGVFTIIFDGVLTVVNGSNIKIGSNFTTQAGSTLNLIFDGTNYYQLSRSFN